MSDVVVPPRKGLAVWVEQAVSPVAVVALLEAQVVVQVRPAG